ncbi:MAG: tail fiber domain-containing protein, partial [Patescibacteria group bacterium]|nr:tail fiber domain-containing protein [Patescibacteria group bacterium]
TIYNDAVGTDSANHRLWEELQTVTPNSNGIASVELGTNHGQLAPLCNNGVYPLTLANHPCGIPQSILDSREGLFLGVTINSNPELNPRQQLANVSLANEAQTLQGLLPTTDSNLTTNTNAVLALNSSGMVSIPGNNPTTIESQQGSLTIAGNGLTLSSEGDANANVQLYADGFGLIDIQKPLENSTNNNNVRSSDGQSTAAGAVEIDDLFAILATSSGQSAFTINQDGNGPIISASSSGTAKFTVDKDGNVIASGNLTGANLFARNLDISGNISSSLIPDQVGNYSIGTDFAPWKNIFTENIYLPSTGGVDGYLTLSNGAVYPTNISNDLLIGATSSDAASFHVIASGKNAGNIISSGNLFLKGTNPSVSVLNGQSFTIQTTTDTNNGTSIPRLYVSNNGQVGIGTTNPVDPLQVQGDIRIGTGSNGCVKSANGSIIAGTCSSDERLKQNIQALPNNILSKIVDLQPVTFYWRSSEFPQFGFGDQINYGLVAQQVETTLPELVEDNGPGGYKAVKYQLLPMFLLEAVREQQQEIQNIKSTFQNISVTDSGNLSLVPNSDGNNDFSVVDPLGEVLTSFGAFSKIFVGNITAGVIRSETIMAKNVNIAGQSLQDYITGIVNQVLASKNTNILSPIAQVDEVHTNIISPLAQNPQIAIALNDNSIEIRKNASGSAVAIIDNSGNASFSGVLSSNNLAVNGFATVSGTLYVHRIKADDIEGPLSTNSAQYITNITNNYYATPAAEVTISTPSSNTSFISGISNVLPTDFIPLGSSSAVLTYIPNLHATTATFDQGLMSFGPTALSDTSITGQLSIDGQFIFSNNSINVLGADLQLQPLGQGGVSIANGKVQFDNNGNLTVNGTSEFRDIVRAKILSPLPNQNLEIRLGNDNTINNKVLIENASGSAVFSFNSQGDFTASGSATIGKLNFSIIPQAEAISEFEVVATGSAGTTFINSYHREITIDDPLVTSNSLIYISPVGQSSQQPFLLRQVPGASFTVGIKLPSANPVQFNWLIVN